MSELLTSSHTIAQTGVARLPALPCKIAPRVAHCLGRNCTCSAHAGGWLLRRPGCGPAPVNLQACPGARTHRQAGALPRRLGLDLPAIANRAAAGCLLLLGVGCAVADVWGQVTVQMHPAHLQEHASRGACLWDAVGCSRGSLRLRQLPCVPH